MATSMIQTPNMGANTGWTPGEDGWGDPMNANFFTLDALMNLVFESMDLNAPPVTAAAGARYAIGSAPTGVWSAQAGKIAYRLPNGNWLYFTPRKGWRASYNGGFYYHTGTAWEAEPASGGTGNLGTRVSTLETGFTAHGQRLQTAEGLLQSQGNTITAHGQTLNEIASQIAEMKLISLVSVNGSRTVAPADLRKMLEVVSAQAVVISVDITANQNIAPGSSVTFIHGEGTPRLTFAGLNSVTIVPPAGGTLESAGPGAMLTLYKKSAMVWHLAGQTLLANAISDAQRLYFLSTGAAINVNAAAQVRRVIIDGPSPASVAVTLPTTPADGHELKLSTVPAIPVLSFIGGTVAGLPASVAAGGTVRLQYHKTQNKWFPA